MPEQQSNIKTEFNTASIGLNMDNSINQIQKGQLSYALNAALENYDNNSTSYQNEPANEFCLQFPSGYQLIGNYFIGEQNKHIFFLSNPLTGISQIGYMDNNDCIYHTLVEASCLNFDINHPIHKVVHKITNCTTEIYWTDGYNPRRYLDINNIPYKLISGTNLCNPVYGTELDCNQLKIQPNFEIPLLKVTDITTGGSLLAGTYQFAIQYSDAAGNPYTSYYSVTNPTPIANTNLTTLNFNYEVGKSIVVDVTNLDGTGQWQYFNMAVIKTINDIASVELIGTYSIEATSRQITYTGQNQTQIKLTINDIFEKYPYYEIAQDLTSVQDILVWDNLISIDRINYQSIASQINLQWQTYKLPANENYSDELNATNLRGYLRDEVYAFEIVFLLKNGKQTDGFHIPGRVKSFIETGTPDVPNTNQDFIGVPDYYVGTVGYSPYWKIYNTGSVLGVGTGNNIGNATPYEFGNFAYWESSETYPCNQQVWGDLAGQPIRHHKFPDVLVSPIFDSPTYVANQSLVMQNQSVFPMGVRVDVSQIQSLVQFSSLTTSQKEDIIGFKIVRGNRGTNKSIVAKGLLRNVNQYTRDDQTYYFPNYPYNDLKTDPFLNILNNAYLNICAPYTVNVTTIPSQGYVNLIYTDCNSNKNTTKKITSPQTLSICSIGKPILNPTTGGTVGYVEYDVYKLQRRGPNLGFYRGWDATWNDYILGLSSAHIPGFPTSVEAGELTVRVVPGTVPYKSGGRGDPIIIFVSKFRVTNSPCNNEIPLPYTSDNYRQVFNSPETSFGQPYIGDTIRLENVMFGGGRAHFVEVKNNALYRLLSKEAQSDALDASQAIGAITDPFSASAMFAAYQAYLQIYINAIIRKNYAYSFNSIASYNYSKPIANDLGIKQRPLTLGQYLIPTIQSSGEGDLINNWNRETCVYLKTDKDKTALPTPDKTPSIFVGGLSIVSDNSRYTISGAGQCDSPQTQKDISVLSYYASIKNTFINQWGQIYSYETIDTGFQKNISDNSEPIATVFGGDTFISKFAFKIKVPFFITNRVNAPDDSDVFYDQAGNIAYPKYWHSSRSELYDYNMVATSRPNLTNFISVKATKFDCPNEPALAPKSNLNRTYLDGYFYMFAYGIPSFYCESSYNVDLRQAFNSKEGDFWPHVSTFIPDDWVQETNVPIIQDNTYYYNVTFSKQNKENFFSHLTPDWDSKLCYTNYPFRAIYSDTQQQNADNRVNNWLSYRAISLFDFPQNFGKLTSLDGIQNKAILARFENKSLLYNTMLTINTSNPQAAYLGNDSLFKSSPPIDFAETDLGYVGSQNKFLLKIPQGQITIDAKRGQIFLISGNQATDLTGFGSGVNRFMTDHLAFEILRWFPEADVDNNFKGLGLHGVYDSKFDRIIITKLDYIPLNKDIKYNSTTKEFYITRVVDDLSYIEQVFLSDTTYFCNKSWTLSFNMNTKSWISFHSYIPNWYIAENNFFYSGLNSCCDDGDAAGFELLVGTLNRDITTSTTTTFPPPEPTTTTTTTAGPDCSLAGEVVITSCELAGEAIEIYTPPTTTICQRPPNLSSEVFIRGYRDIPGNITVDTTGSLIDACAGINYISANYATISVNFFSFSFFSLHVNSVVYLFDNNTDCTVVPDGWYSTSESLFTNTVYHVEGGIITSITEC